MKSNQSQNNQYMANIKEKLEKNIYNRKLPLIEENENENEYVNKKKKYVNNNSNNNNFKNNTQTYGHNKFIGIKRENIEKNASYNPNFKNRNSPHYHYKNTKRFNQNFNYNYNNRNYSPNNFNYYNNDKNIKNNITFHQPIICYQRNNYYINRPRNFFRNEIPIYHLKDQIIKSILSNRVTIITGEAGCGKSTQIPQYIYELDCNCKILLIQPTSIAARSIAIRLAQEMHEEVGGIIGYQVSMNQKISNDTKILVKTPSIFLEELLHKNLEYTYIIIDKLYEKDIYEDLIMALIKYYFERNPRSEIKVIIMGATIDERYFANYFKDINGDEVPIIKVSEYNKYGIYEFGLEEIIRNIRNDIDISEDSRDEVKKVSNICLNQDESNPIFIEELFPIVASIIEKIENDYKDNGVLIFLPGLEEILRLKSYLIKYFINKNNLEFLILHSQSSDYELDLVFTNTLRKRKVILATNIAESVTFSNIFFIIDFCLIKQTRYDEYQNVSVTELIWCSKYSMQQRKRMITKNEYYFKLITEKLNRKLTDYPESEILRMPLERLILKLKIYKIIKEPQEILMKTIKPLKKDKIINTILKLENIGALTLGYFPKKREGIFKENETMIISKKESLNKTIYKYKSGNITKVGRIFAELPIDIKYSRLIIIAYALGQIDLGITLAAILSQEKSIFLSSDKCNRVNIFNSKNNYCFKQSCDFIACYTAYKKWYDKWGNIFLRTNVKFDTQLQEVNSALYELIKEDTFAQSLDLIVLKEIIKAENDLKKRLTKLNLYSQYFSSYAEKINFEIDEDVFLLKVILAGTFYNQIFCPDYDDIRNIEDDILLSLDAPDQEYVSEFKTIKIINIKMEDALKLINIISALIYPEEILSYDYDKEKEIYKITFPSEESIKKILFITSNSFNRGKEIPIFEYIKKNTDSINKEISLGSNNYNSDINKKLTEKLEYYYEVHYFDEYTGEKVYQDKDSINLIHIIPNLEQLKLTKIVTDSYNRKLDNIYEKSARYTSLLPKEPNFDKLIMLIFGPKYEMVGLQDEKKEKYLKYIGFQSYGLKNEGFNNFIFINDSKFIKLDYLITNYHLQIINEIRVLINEMIKFEFISKDHENIDNDIYTNNTDNEEEKELQEEEFKEIFMEYKKK